MGDGRVSWAGKGGKGGKGGGKKGASKVVIEAHRASSVGARFSCRKGLEAPEPMGLFPWVLRSRRRVCVQGQGAAPKM